MDEKSAYIALNMMERVGPVVVRSLVDVLGSAQAIFEAGGDALMQARGVGRELAEAIFRQRDTVNVEEETARAAELGAHVITPLDGEYPACLKAIHDPPLALYVRGTIQDRDRHAVAVVGTRRPTHYGRACAEQFTLGLVQAGYTVVSGLAAGIDTVAHQAAVRGQGRTLAVLGSALDCLYPPENAALAEAIAEGHGAVMSEFPLGRKPDKTTFPMRNRIVSGLSVGVLVVEAGVKSGARITADQALEQGRAVFAVPGRIDSPASAGTNALIKTGAKLVSSLDDILEDFEFLLPPQAPGKPASRGASAAMPRLGETEQVLVDLLVHGERNVDELIRESGLAPAAVSSTLIALEMKRAVRMLPGRVVELRVASPA